MPARALANLKPLHHRRGSVGANLALSVVLTREVGTHAGVSCLSLRRHVDAGSADLIAAPCNTCAGDVCFFGCVACVFDIHRRVIAQFF